MHTCFAISIEDTFAATISVQIVFTAILSAKKKTTCECMTQGREKLLHYLRKDFMCIEISVSFLIFASTFIHHH